MPADATEGLGALSIAGRIFRPAVEPSVAQKAYWDLQVRKIGGPTYPDTVEAFDAFVEAAIDTDRLKYLLAACLVEDGQPWTREWAGEAADLLWNTTDPNEVALISGMIHGVLIRFFPGGAASSVISPTASPAPVRKRESKTKRSGRSKRTTALGRRSSGKSPATTGIASPS